jgi:hypothetical protein
LALLAESDGDYQVAESHLLEAARVDNTFLPRWSLANFYFRRQDEGNFWNWARKANQMSSGDTSALYGLCWRMTDDADLILDRVIPDDPDHLVRYLLFLMKDNRLEAGLEVARRLTSAGGANYKGILVGYCEQLLISRDAQRALATWNMLAEQGLIPHPPLKPEQGRSLTDPGFRHTPLGRGFAWRLLEADGQSIRHTPGALRLSFSGEQADHLELVLQYVPLAPASTYRVRARWADGSPTVDSGLRWQVVDAQTGVVLALEHDPPIFRTGPETSLGRLTLRYDRPSGVTALRCDLTLEEVVLERVGPGD